MRLWSFAPDYLDVRGLVAQWREALLAQKVLTGKTKGYRNHPQLARFLKTSDPLVSIGSYLLTVYRDGRRRGYMFDKSKIIFPREDPASPILIPLGQLGYERKLLLYKQRLRDPIKYEENKKILYFRINPVFTPIEGHAASWEQVFYFTPDRFSSLTGEEKFCEKTITSGP